MTDFQQGMVVGAIVVLCVAVGLMAAGPWLALGAIRRLFAEMGAPDSDPPPIARPYLTQDDTQ